MTGMSPTSTEDRLGVFLAAQIHGYPLLFLPEADRGRPRPAAGRPSGTRRLVGTLARRRLSTVDPAPCPSC